MMEKLTTFEILLDNGGAVVRPGDIVSGQLVLELSEDMPVNAVRISFTGTSSVQWAEAQKASPMSEISSSLVEPITARETYFNQSLILWPRQTDSNSAEARNTDTEDYISSNSSISSTTSSITSHCISTTSSNSSNDDRNRPISSSNSTGGISSNNNIISVANSRNCSGSARRTNITETTTTTNNTNIHSPSSGRTTNTTPPSTNTSTNIPSHTSSCGIQYSTTTTNISSRNISSHTNSSRTNTSTTSANLPLHNTTSNGISNSTQILEKGAHSLDFHFHVPSSVPSSFEGKHGAVLYKLKALVEGPLRKGSREVETNTRDLTVMSSLDLNDVYDAGDSTYTSCDLKVSTLFIPSGDCHATMRLQQKGFVHGETIPVEYSIYNNSAHCISNVSLLLQMITVYKAGQKKCETERILTTTSLGKVAARQRLEGVNENLRVPVTCQPSGLPGCRIIDVKYRIELKIKPNVLCFKRMKLHTDVIIGTTPLTVTPFHDNPPDYWSCCRCPPSYEELMDALPQYSTSLSPSPSPSSYLDPPSPIASTSPPPYTQVTDQEGASSSYPTSPDSLPRCRKYSSNQCNSLLTSNASCSLSMLPFATIC